MTSLSWYNDEANQELNTGSSDSHNASTRRAGDAIYQAAVQGGENLRYCKDKHINEVPDTLDEKIWSEIKDKIKTDTENKFNYEVENTSRSVGTRLSHHIYKKFGNNKLEENTVHILSLIHI